MDILSKIELKDVPTNIAINPNANQVFTSDNNKNMISLFDFESETKSKILEIEKPREIYFEPESNRIYSIYGKTGFFTRNTGKKLGVIDLNSNQLIKEIGKNEGFAGIDRNSQEKKIYVSQPNDEQVWIIDEKTLEVENQIDARGHYKRVIFVENKNELILGDYSLSRGIKIRSYNFNTNQIREIFSSSGGSAEIDSFEMKYYPQINKLYVQQNIIVGELAYKATIFLIDFENPKEKYELNNCNICPHFDRSNFNGITSYITKRENSKIESKHKLIKKNLITQDEQSFDIDFSDYFPDHIESYHNHLIHPKTGNLIIPVAKGRHYYLCEVSLD
jgi:DNA-binding beta-propeller fold protein YncE